MWIQEIQKDYKQNKSSFITQNYLWRKDDAPLYVMDNHLAAAWCWMQECDKTAVYNFMHIDQHADLLNNLTFKNYGFLKDKNLTFEEYHGLRRPLGTGSDDTYPVFCWDNYIVPMMKLFPNWFDESFYATLNELDYHERQAIGFRPNWHQNQLTLAGYVETAFRNNWNEWDEIIGKEHNKWIVNLDMDYFFTDHSQMLTDAYIVELSQRIRMFLDRIQVMTVAISPECCGGWEQAEHVFKVFCEGFPEFNGFLTEKESIIR